MKGKKKKIFHTKKFKKTIAPYFNEKFQVGVFDSERETIIVRICSGDKCVRKGRNYIGEVSFSLMESLRNFDYPDYCYEWYRLINGTGEVKLYIQFVDNQKTCSAGQEINNKKISEEVKIKEKKEKYLYKNFPDNWKQLLQQIGIGQKQLGNDPNLCRKLYKIFKEAEKDAKKNGNTISLNQPFKDTQNIEKPCTNTLHLIQQVKLRKATPQHQAIPQTLISILTEALMNRRQKIMGNDDVEEWSEYEED